MPAELKPTITYEIVSDLDSKPVRPLIAPLMKAFNKETGHDIYFIKDKHEENMRWYLAKDQEQIVGVMNFNLNAHKDSKILHVITLKPITTPFAFHCIGWAYVKPEYRRIGVFRNFVEMSLKHDALVTVQAPVTNEALRLLGQYKSRGQVYVYKDENIPALAFLIPEKLKSERKFYTNA